MKFLIIFYKRFIINHSLEHESFQVQTRKRAMSSTPPLMIRPHSPTNLNLSPLK